MDAVLTRIKEALAGASSQKPVPEEQLLTLGGAEEVGKALNWLRDQRAVNCCRITRKGFTGVVWWLTGVNVPAMSPLQWNQGKHQDKKPAKPREKLMSHEGKTGSAILELIGRMPGMGLGALLAELNKQLPELTSANLSQHLLQLKKAGKIEAHGARGSYIYYPAGSAPQAATAGLAIPQFLSQEKTAAATPAPAAKPEASAHATLDDGSSSGRFGVTLDHENHLHISAGEEVVMLKPHQAIVLKAFLNRIALEAA